jgi:hypothetical protein
MKKNVLVVITEPVNVDGRMKKSAALLATAAASSAAVAASLRRVRAFMV